MTQASPYRSGWIWIAVIGLLLALATCATARWELDLSIARLFYRSGDEWYLAENQPWQWLYHYGPLPGIVFSVGALAGWLICRFDERWKHWRRYFLLVVLTSAIGGGVITNIILKPYWGRPRPFQIEQFGGAWKYHEPYEPGEPGKGASFPCGHCTMGFVFGTLIFFRPLSRRLAYAGGALGVASGIILGITRMVQGAHFFSDVYWALGIMALTAVTLYYFVLRIPLPHNAAPVSRSRRNTIKAAAIAAICAAAMAAAFMAFYRPYFETLRRSFRIDREVEEIMIRPEFSWEKQKVVFKETDRGRVVISSQGFGWPTASCSVELLPNRQEKRLELRVKIIPDGFFAELTHQVEVWLPQELEGRVLVLFEAKASGSKEETPTR